MALRFNNTEITKVIYNGTEQKALKFNNSGYFGKLYTLTQNSSTGVSFSISRTSSPNQQAGTGSISTGSTIYHGDTLTISVTAATNYENPKLYVNIGDGNGFVLRTSPFSFTVGSDVTFYGTATYQDTWQTVWSGSQVFTNSGSFTVNGLASGGEVQISATIEFTTVNYDPYNDQESSYQTTETLSNEILPRTVYGYNAYVSFSRSGNQISFQFVPYEQEFKGFYTYEYPSKVTITSVRRKS